MPDAEGVTVNAGDPGAVYVSTERNGNGGTRPSVLRSSTTGASTTLDATNDWDLSADLPAFPANGSLEAIAWVPDSVLVAKGFHDDVTNGDYAPGTYPDTEPASSSSEPSSPGRSTPTR